MKESSTNGDTRIGVYVCHCGTNIAGAVDVDALTEYAAGLPGVTVSRSYKYMCSDPGQELITEDIAEQGLDRVVVAACSPSLHEATFRLATEKGGINPYYFQMVNIREHNAWVHDDVEAGAGQRGGDGGGRRYCRHPLGADAGQLRQAGVPGGAGTHHRRPHGPVR